MKVLIENGSVGTVAGTESGMLETGSWVVIRLHDENGNPIEDQGTILDILGDE